MTAHYRKQLNFTLEGLEQSAQALARLWDFADRLGEVPEDAEGADLSAQVAAAQCATALGVFMVPVFYVVVQRTKEKAAEIEKNIEEKIHHHEHE